MSEQKIGHMAVPNLGGEPSAQEERDAVHMAVAPVVAAATLLPGQRVGFLPDGRGASVQPFVGVVDPFLKTPVLEGQRFWLLVEPNTITSLRHQWTHPAFQGELGPINERAAAEAWLRDYAADVGINYDRMMEAAGNRLLDKGEYSDDWITLDFQTPERVWRDAAEFWKKYHVLVPTAKVPDGYSETFITCTC